MITFNQGNAVINHFITEPDEYRGLIVHQGYVHFIEMVINPKNDSEIVVYITAVVQESSLNTEQPCSKRSFPNFVYSKSHEVFYNIVSKLIDELLTEGSLV